MQDQPRYGPERWNDGLRSRAEAAVPAEIQARLPTMGITASSSSSRRSYFSEVEDDTFQDACMICLEPFNSIDPAHVTNCRHDYHYQCISKWSNIKNKCPICCQQLVSFSLKITITSENPSNEGNTMPTILLISSTSRRGRVEITHPIGISNNGMVHVYQATWSSIGKENAANKNSLTQHVAVKCINGDCQPIVTRNLKTDVKRNIKIPYHPNIVGVTAEFDYNRYYYVVFPLMEHSLRSIMHARFSKGFPEECVVVALKEILKALCFIHTENDLDLGINAGNIFFDGKAIKLAFSGCTYKSQDQNQPSSSSFSPPYYMPMDSICEWAAAPENPSKEYAHKADVWMLGITAVELAYGGILASSKKDLQDRLLKIEAYKQLPSRWIHDKEYENHILMSKLLKQRTFSKAFQKMVVDCLSWRPHMRPTVQELLAYEIFTNCKDMNYFSRVVGE